MNQDKVKRMVEEFLEANMKLKSFWALVVLQMFILQNIDI